MNMKNLILKWLGLDDPLLQYPQRDASDIEDMIIKYLAQAYDLDGMASKLEDMDYLTQDLESRGNRWDEISDNLEGIDLEEVAYQHQIDGLKDNLDKVQQLDDRLTELLEGYKLDVRLVQEDF
jgi:predicted nuclease with TOPRIM domain